MLGKRSLLMVTWISADMKQQRRMESQRDGVRGRFGGVEFTLGINDAGCTHTTRPTSSAFPAGVGGNASVAERR